MFERRGHTAITYLRVSKNRYESCMSSPIVAAAITKVQFRASRSHQGAFGFVCFYRASSRAPEQPMKRCGLSGIPNAPKQLDAYGTEPQYDTGATRLASRVFGVEVTANSVQ